MACAWHRQVRRADARRSQAHAAKRQQDQRGKPNRKRGGAEPSPLFPYPSVLYHVKPHSAASSLFLSSVHPFPVAHRAPSHFDYKPLYARTICLIRKNSRAPPLKQTPDTPL